MHIILIKYNLMFRLSAINKKIIINLSKNKIINEY